MAKRAKSSNGKKKKSQRPVKSAVRRKAAKSKAPKTITKTAAAKANVMPCLTCRDAPAAVAFLCEAFGFKKKMVVEGDGGSIAHAELTLGNAMVMLGSPKDTDYGRLVAPPREVGISTQTIYLVVPNPDAHHDRAKAAGAEIVLPLTTKEYGGRDYTCRDPEGHVWTFGTYDPWA